MTTKRADSLNIRAEFQRWLVGEWRSGARLVIIEGLMKSGKSRLTKEPFTIVGRQSTNIELDKFLRAPVNPDIEYMEAIDLDAATAAIWQAMRISPPVIVEGPMAWPVTQRAREEVPAGSVRRVYLKRVSPRNPDEWEDLEFAQELPRPTAYGRSIDRYHVGEQPWLLADLILERTGRDDD